MTAEKFHLLCLGYGYTARHVRAALRGRPWEITGTLRPPLKQGQDIPILPFDAGSDEDGNISPAIRAAVKKATHILSAIPPQGVHDPVLHSLGEAIRDAENLRWIGYLSTTGVYGDRGGAWVDEQTPPAPTTERGRSRAAAEREWLDLYLCDNAPVHIFRLPGIYGPGRNALTAVRTGRAHRIVKPGQVFSRIHVEDLALVLIASMNRPRPGAIYNVCDDLPAPPQDVTAYACSLLEVPPPPAIAFEEADLSPMARSFYAENKRVRNDLIKRELGIALAYPDYRAGLKALFRAGDFG